MRSSLRARLVVSCLAVLAVGCASVNPPPVARDATPLAFSDFYVRPVGPRGLEPTPTLLGLDGKRVAVRGFMVHEEEPFPGFFIFTSVPETLAERADGPADMLPPATIFVHLPEAQREEIVNHVPAELELVGTLELGAMEEQGGRISYVRLRLDDLDDARVADADKK